jgi:hypothetical protein
VKGNSPFTALVFAQLPSAAERLSYLGMFGVGSIAGMAVASALVGASLRSLVGARRGLLAGAGALSIVLGIAWSIPLWPIVA